MKKIELQTSCKKMLADVFTPVECYLRLRDRFRDTILLESTDHHAADNSTPLSASTPSAAWGLQHPEH